MSSSCVKWIQNPGVNPRTNRKIKIGGPVYKKLEKECNKLSKQPTGSGADKKNKVKGKVVKLKPPVHKKLISDSKISSLFHDREQLALQIKSQLNLLHIPLWKGCVSGSDTTFKSNLTNIKRIGYGCFGEVYTILLGSFKFAIKETLLTKAEKTKLVKSCTNFPEEYRISILLQNLLTSIPNYLYIYDNSLCDNCIVFGKTGYCFNTIMELADSSMDVLIEKKLTPKTYKSMLYQLLIGVSAYQNNYGIIHKDIKLENILIKNIPKGGYLPYTNIPCKVDNVGVLLLIADFGVAVSQLPKYSGTNNNYGLRNAKVVTLPSGEKMFEPITCKWSVQLGKNNTSLVTPSPVNWTDDNGNIVAKSTINRFYGKRKLEPSILVNLDDPLTFPPFEFFTDVQDIIRMFIGGKRTTQPGNHRGFLDMLPTDMRNELGKYSHRFVPKLDSVYYLFADEFMAKICKNLKT